MVLSITTLSCGTLSFTISFQTYWWTAYFSNVGISFPFYGLSPLPGKFSIPSIFHINCSLPNSVFKNATSEAFPDHPIQIDFPHPKTHPVTQSRQSFLFSGSHKDSKSTATQQAHFPPRENSDTGLSLRELSSHFSTLLWKNLMVSEPKGYNRIPN